MKVKIEPVTIDDLPAILRIERLGFNAEEAGNEAEFRDRINKLPDTFLVAKIGSQVVGFVVGPAVKEKYVQDEMYVHTPTNLPKGGNQLIYSIATDPEYRGNGIGSKLLSALEKEARAHQRETISLDSLEKNVPFYEHNGFKRVQISQSSHANETWFNMVKKL